MVADHHRHQIWPWNSRTQRWWTRNVKWERRIGSCHQHLFSLWPFTSLIRVTASDPAVVGPTSMVTCQTLLACNPPPPPFCCALGPTAAADKSTTVENTWCCASWCFRWRVSYVLRCSLLSVEGLPVQKHIQKHIIRFNCDQFQWILLKRASSTVVDQSQRNEMQDTNPCLISLNGVLEGKPLDPKEE